jgi:hypothetical protein
MSSPSALFILKVVDIYWLVRYNQLMTIHRNLLERFNSRVSLRVFYSVGRPPTWTGRLIMSRPVFPSECLRPAFVGPINEECCHNPDLTEKLDDFYTVTESIARQMADGSGIEPAILYEIYDNIYNLNANGVSDFRIKLLRHLVQVHQIPGNTVINPHWNSHVTIDNFMNDSSFLSPYNFHLPTI